MTDPVQIIPATTPQNLAQIETLFREYQGWLDEDICFQSFEDELKDLKGHYDILLLARINDKACGCIAISQSSAQPKIGELRRLYVRPDFRNNGIARNLCQQALDRARLLGYASLFLETLPSLEEATKLYKSFSFQEVDSGGKPVIRLTLDL